jgi:RNA polymerase sigma-70 factor (ECF subfamily)
MSEGREVMHGGLETAFREERRRLFLLAYRITGSVTDAEDVVQETFLRALATPPAHTDWPWAPWLQRVAANAARDALRRRKRTRYVGQWLPAPIETDAYGDLLLPAAHEPESTAGRYELLESVSIAFLTALEALTPTQRAVLVLCDVIEYAAREAGEALGLREANVRQILLRARRAMAAYDHSSRRFDPAHAERTRETLGRMLLAFAQRDVTALAALLAEDVVTWHDGGGEFLSAMRPVRGRSRVVRLHLGIARDDALHVRIVSLNGLPAVVAEYAGGPHRLARRFVLAVQLNDAGEICEIRSLVATPKLAGIDWAAQAAI